MKYVLEVCVDSVQSAIEAQKGGAKRVELCSNLIIGGTSPGSSVFRQIREYTDLHIRVLLRPRFGDFCYDEHEFRVLKEEVEMFGALGADGVVAGILTPDGHLDEERMGALKAAAGKMKVTLHRAFDLCRDPMETLEKCMDLGIDTILTSGQKASAWEGKELLQELQKAAKGKIEILAGAGINSRNIKRLAEVTGISSFHMSGKQEIESKMIFRRTGVPMGLPGFSEYQIWQTDCNEIAEAVKQLEQLGQEGWI